MRNRAAALASGLIVLAACGRSGEGSATFTPTPTSTSPTPTPTGSATPTPTPVVDQDGDGLDDGFEAGVAASYMPFLAIAANDACPLGGMLYRVRPHPSAGAYLNVVYDHLFQNDCGTFGHVGDDEVFAVTIDPTKPAPEGILAIKAISHQGTICEKDTTCGSLPGLTPCSTADVGGKAWPVVFSSKDKHGSYADLNVCQTQSCFDTCTLPPTSPVLPMQNAGEPGGHLTDDLTSSGFITAANGWTEAGLMDFDPWVDQNFGGAGSVAKDLVDPAFVTPVP